MSRYVRPHVARMAAYTPGEQPRDGALVKLNTNENPYPASPRVREALRRESNGVLERYPEPMADSLRAAAARRYGVRREQVLAGNGSDELLAIVVRACVGEGGRVAYATPTYSLYRTLTAAAGAFPVEVSFAVAPEGPLRLPKALYDADAAVTFVCHPNSPYGAPLELAELDRLCAASPGLVVSDEAYVDFGARSALELLAKRPNLVVLRSFSKSFSLAGLRLGLAFAAPELIMELAKVKDSYNVSRLAIAAGVAALEDVAWMQANVARVVATRERVRDVLRARGWRVLSSAANFLWVEHPQLAGVMLYERLRARGILVRYFDDEPLRSGVRVTIGTEDEMDRFLAAIETVAA